VVVAIPSDLISEYEWERLRRHWGLTAPEMAVVKLLFLGRPEAEMVRMLAVSPPVLQVRIKHIYEILGLSTRLHLVLYVLAALRECCDRDDGFWL
jgi:DNA-binding CsgD family transcriptional regulator